MTIWKLTVVLFVTMMITGCASSENVAKTASTQGVLRMKISSLDEKRYDRPTYIEAISPLEDSWIPYSEYIADRTENYAIENGIQYVGALRFQEIGYNSTICLRLNLEPLVQPGDSLVDEASVQERITLRVNGKIQSEIVDYDSASNFFQANSKSWGGPFTFCWYSDLAPGKHDVSFVFRLYSGELETYEWQFSVVEG